MCKVQKLGGIFFFFSKVHKLSLTSLLCKLLMLLIKARVLKKYSFFSSQTICFALVLALY